MCSAPDSAYLVRRVRGGARVPDPSTFVLPGAVRDVLSGEDLAAGTGLELGPWDVRVLLEV